MSPHPHRGPRLRVMTAMTAAGLVALSGIIWSLPAIHRPGPSQTQAEIALQREQARSADLRLQLTSTQADLDEAMSTMSGDVSDATARADDLKIQLTGTESLLEQSSSDLSRQLAEASARADDLAAQLAAATAALMAPDVNARDAAQAGVYSARADSLSEQLGTAHLSAGERISALAAEAASAQARADDLKAQLDAVQAEPVAVASMTRQQIIDSTQVFGMYTAQSPFDYSELEQNEVALDRDASVVGYFQSWDDEFRPDAVEDAWLRGDVPLLTWEGRSQGDSSIEQPQYSLPTVYGGQHDDYLRRYAQAIVATGLPLIIRMNHEMNGTFYPWSEIRGWDGTSVNGNHRGDYVRAWRHVHDIFQAEGANDLVVWMWAPNRIDRLPSQPLPDAFYPGDDYVDIVGMDAYWRVTDLALPATFDSTFGATLPLLRPYSKPIWLAETGATDTGGDKVDWINNFFDALQEPENADVHGFMSFALTVTSNQGTNTWSFTSTAATTQAARDGLAESGFGRPR